MGLLENALVAEQFCRQDSAMGMALLFSGFATECIFRFGGGGLAEKFVLPVVEGRSLSACAFFETGMFGDLASVSTTIREDNGHILVNGEKNFVANGMNASFFVVLGRKEGENGASGGSGNVFLAVVEGDQKGIHLTDAGQTIGNNMVAFGHVRFDNVRIDAGNLLEKSGAVHGGGPAFLNEARIQLSAMALGRPRALLTGRWTISGSGSSSAGSWPGSR